MQLIPRLTDQVALVTGASGGIGRAAALALAQEGATLALVARRGSVLRDLAKEIQEMGMAAEPFTADIRDPEAVQSAVDAVMGQFGRVDILVNGAGITLPERTMQETSAEGWSTILGVNLSGAFYCTKAVLPTMRSQGRGTVVNLSSYVGLRAARVAGPAYSAAKAGLIRLNESINVAERDYGIRACVICPGEVDTPMLRNRPKQPTEDELAIMLAPEDIASAIVFVATLPQRATVEEIVIRPTLLRVRRDGLAGTIPR